MSPRLPVELYKIIIDNLDAYEDKTTLCACSLTCKSFLHASRYHLFHYLRLTNARQAHLLLNSSTNPGAYVRRLFLCGKKDYLWLNDALPFIVTHLPDVTTLTLNSLTWTSHTGAALSAILSGFCKVKHLEVTYLLFATSSHMNELIASFPSLVNLVCDVTIWERYEVPVIPLPPNVESITLAPFQSNFFDQLLSLQSHHNLRTIKFRHTVSRSMPNMGKLLKTLGPRLEHVDLSGLPESLASDTQAVPECHIDLTHNPNLRSVNLELPSTLSTLFEIWSQITSCHLLEQLALEVFLVSLSDVDNDDWPGIDHYFAQQQWVSFPKLVVRIKWLGKVEIGPEAIALIKARLPFLEGRGYLNCLQCVGLSAD